MLGVRRWWLATVAVLILGSGTGCVLGARSSATPLPPSPPTVRVVLTDGAIEFDPAIPAGRVVFDVVNGGTTEHSMNLLSLPEDFPPILEQVRGQERRGTPAVARVPRLAPGQQSTFAVDLKPGRYAMLCLVASTDGVIHSVTGEAAEFRII